MAHKKHETSLDRRPARLIPERKKKGAARSGTGYKSALVVTSCCMPIALLYY